MEKKNKGGDNYEAGISSSAQLQGTTISSAGSSASASATTAATAKDLGMETKKDGKHLITMEAIRREIWLNSGAIKSKQLMRKFDVNKNTPERQALFKSIVMELCTMVKDADGNKLVLKQHYAKSG